MEDIHVNIYKGEAFESRISLRHQENGTYKLEHPSADTDSVFTLIDDNINDLVMYALMNISNKKG